MTLNEQTRESMQAWIDHYYAEITKLEAKVAEQQRLLDVAVGALSGSESLLQDAQDIMRAYVLPGGISATDGMKALIALLDNTRQRKVQHMTNQALTEIKQGMGI